MHSGGGQRDDQLRRAAAAHFVRASRRLGVSSSALLALLNHRGPYPNPDPDPQMGRRRL